MKRALIVGSAEIECLDKLIEASRNCEFIVCADGGLSHLERVNILPDMVIGDFDSYNGDGSILNKLDKENILKLQKEKDFTDLEIAIIEVSKRGYSNLIIFGALYGRLDHTYANIDLIASYFSKGMNIRLIGDKDSVYVTDSITKESTMNDTYVSLFAYTDKVHVVKTIGLKYPLKDHWLERRKPLGVSNEAIDKSWQVEVDSGILLVIISKK